MRTTLSRPQIPVRATQLCHVNVLKQYHDLYDKIVLKFAGAIANVAVGRDNETATGVSSS